MNEKIKALYVEDDPEWQAGIRHYLAGYGEIDLIACVSTIGEAFTVLRQAPVDIVIMDIMLSQAEVWGLDAALDIALEFPQVKVIMLSSLDENDEIFNEAFMNGAYEYIYKQDFEQLPGAMLNAMRNQPHKFGERLRKLVMDQKKELLSPRDIELLTMILEGKSQLDMARELSVSLAAIKKQIGRLMKKFNWRRSSRELAEKCSKWGLLER